MLVILVKQKAVDWTRWVLVVLQQSSGLDGD